MLRCDRGVCGLASAVFSPGSALLGGVQPELVASSLAFLSTSELGTLCSVSQSFLALGSSDMVWKVVYEERFGDLNVGEDRFKRAMEQRLKDPQVGDVVEVAWRGKFHLDVAHVFTGRSWWDATVVEKDPCGASYKVHYSSWNRRWDEWVPPDRLRWPSRLLTPAAAAFLPTPLPSPAAATAGPSRSVGGNSGGGSGGAAFGTGTGGIAATGGAASAVGGAASVLTGGNAVARGEAVEVWCYGGDNVGGAWLEARVRRATRCAVLLTDAAVTTGQQLWVTADRVRRQCEARRPLCNPSATEECRRCGRVRRLARAARAAASGGVRRFKDFFRAM